MRIKKESDWRDVDKIYLQKTLFYVLDRMLLRCEKMCDRQIDKKLIELMEVSLNHQLSRVSRWFHRACDEKKFSSLLCRGGKDERRKKTSYMGEQHRRCAHQNLRGGWLGKSWKVTRKPSACGGNTRLYKSLSSDCCESLCGLVSECKGRC